MKLKHFKNNEEAIEYITSDLLWSLREDLAAMQGSAGDRYTDEEYNALAAKIDDIAALAPQLAVAEAA